MLRVRMPWYSIAVWLLSFIVGGYFFVRSLKNLSMWGEDNYWKVIFCYSLLGREYFTVEGWRYKQRAQFIPFFGFVVGIILWVTVGFC